jgi:hypothetical protein
LASSAAVVAGQEGGFGIATTLTCVERQHPKLW